MRSFTTTELARMQSAQEDAMQDTCRVLVYSSSANDAHNVPDPTYTAGSAIECGLRMTGPKEVHLPSGEVAVIDGEVRLPIGTSLDPKDRVRVTHRYGVELTSSEDYELVGIPQRGPSGLVAWVRKVTRRAD